MAIGAAGRVEEPLVITSRALFSRSGGGGGAVRRWGMQDGVHQERGWTPESIWLQRKGHAAARTLCGVTGDGPCVTLLVTEAAGLQAI